MGKPKEVAVITVKDIIEKSLNRVHNELRANRKQINDLAFKQMVLKKEIAELYKLRKTLVNYWEK
jgi:hypothetical protein